VTLCLLCLRPYDGGIKRCFYLTSVCLSVAYIGPNSRTERLWKTKIGTEVAHVARFDSYTTFKVKRSKVNLQGAGAYCGDLPNRIVIIKMTMMITMT